MILRGRELEKLQTAATILVDQIQTDSHAAKQAQLAYDVFISYAHKNSELANRFLKLLQEKDGDVRVFFDYAELKTGVDWQRTLYDSIDATRCFVALVTQDYQASDVCNEEFNLALARCIAKVCWGGIFYLSPGDIVFLFEPYVSPSSCLCHDLPHSRFRHHFYHSAWPD